MRSKDLNELENMLLDENISRFLECTKKHYATTLDAIYIDKVKRLNDIYEQALIDSGAEELFKILDDYGKNSNKANYTERVIDIITKNGNYDILSDNIRFAIQNVPISDLKQLYRIYQTYHDITDEEVITYEPSVSHGVNEDEEQRKTQKEQKEQEYKEYVRQNLKKIEQLIQEPNISNQMLATAELFNFYEYNSFACRKGTYTEFSDEMEWCDGFVKSFLKKFGVDLTPEDIIKIKNFGSSEEYTQEQINAAMQIINLPTMDEPHFDVQKFEAIGNAYITTFNKYNASYSYNIIEQEGVILNTLDGNYQNITRQDDSRKLLKELGPEEIKKAIIQSCIISLKLDFDSIKDKPTENFIPRFLKGLNYGMEIPYDLSVLTQLNKSVQTDLYKIKEDDYNQSHGRHK